ncbi:MAG: trypsin-like peptidase domain-containing protein [Clostridia bacterium]|nr:trypsin-like peptidase domain-containing protein [Clostridia bacterium]
MNEFEEKKYNTEEKFDDYKVHEGELLSNQEPQEHKNIWHADDFQPIDDAKALAVKEKPAFKAAPKRGIKKYVAILVAAAIVNVAALGGFFAVGYSFGSGKFSFSGKSDVLTQLREEPVKTNTANATNAVSTGAELTTVEISKKVGPAVVGITSTIQGMMSIFNTATVSEGTGSGIIISSDGYIVTNNHVIDGASSVRVTLNTGTEYEAKIIGTDSKTDLAVLKITPDEKLTVAELGDSSAIEVGERAVAIGNPLGMEFFGSTTQGIISAINRTITVDNRTMSVIQTDAAINEGNSGGALVNAYGQVIGINAVKILSSTVEGMGFAIPISEAKPILEDLIEFGYVKGRPVIGISSRDVTEYMSNRQGWPVGVQVMAAQVGSGAEIAGLEQGDIITKADGKAVKTTDELNKIKDSHKPGEVLQLEVWKYETGLTKTISVKLTEERPD